MARQMEQTKERIGENTFYITPFPAFRCANLTGELASVLAPLFGALVPLVGKNGDLMDVDVKSAANAISGCSALDGDKVETLMKKMLLGGHIVVEGFDEEGKAFTERLTQDLADEVFCGEVQQMFVLCFYVIRLNFNGFFKNLGNLFGSENTTVEPKKIPREIL